MEHLDNIKDRDWVLRQCKERIPYTVQGARLLLEFGIKETIKQLGGDPDDNDFKLEYADVSKDMVPYFLYFLLFQRYLERLDLMDTLGLAYSCHDYLNFRSEDLRRYALNFAYDGKIGNILTLVHMYPDLMVSTLVQIIDFIPTIYEPELYRELIELAYDILFKVKKIDIEYKWYDNDWVNDRIEVENDVRFIDTILFAYAKHNYKTVFVF